MSALLGGLTPATFLARHWQKRPLLVRQAVPGFKGLLDRDALLGLAARDDVSSRLVLEHPRRRQRWERHDGPFDGLEASRLPRSHWTLLLHGIESVVPGGWELLRKFDFIPAARIDDLMVSYAAPSGSVGPHDDQYDVFLLQGPGRRRWQVSTRPHRVDPGAAIKVLRDFTPEEDWLLEPGDMLYLPPGVAHHGVAEGGPCFTYSIGFLAPSHADLVQGFLGYLGHALPFDPAALYADPDLRPARDPLEIGDAMVDQVSAVLDRVRWDRGHVEEFLGRFLTMPRPRAVFTPGRPAIPRRGAVHLALPSRALIRRGRQFLNGRIYAPSRALRSLLSERSLRLPVPLSARDRACLAEWLELGWVVSASSTILG